MMRVLLKDETVEILENIGAGTTTDFDIDVLTKEIINKAETSVKRIKGALGKME
jgi:hypothetical protein